MCTDDDGGELEEILNEEYLEMLKNYIQAKKKEGHVILHEDTEMSIAIDSARTNNRLKMADYVCNFELTYNSRKFSEAEKQLFLAMKNDGFCYSFEEDTGVNIVQAYLEQGDIANALAEAVFNAEEKTFSRLLDTITTKISAMGYRGAKVQLDQCTKEFTTYVYMDDDYERSEEFLKKLLDRVIPVFEKNDLPCEKFKYSLELLLTDMYLREGDIDAAVSEMEKCKAAESALSSSLENLLYYYQLVEKEALVCIDSFEFEKGAELMEGACRGFREILECITLVDSLKDRFPTIISEYYGDALCMKIYAQLFLQRFSPELYDSLTKDSDTALCQYGPYEGELERHRQYRSVIELQKGNYEEAAKWLLMTQPGDVNMHSLENQYTLGILDFDGFLKSVIKGEGKTARRYYLMYYVKIMAEAAIDGQKVADDMAYALKRNPAIQEMEDLKDFRRLKTDRGIRVIEQRVTSLDNIIRYSSYMDYHPLEVNYWKHATYWFAKKQYVKAEPLYEKAIKICYLNPNYIQLAVFGLGIRAEYIVCLIDQGKDRKANKEYSTLIDCLEKTSKATSVISVLNFIQKIKDSVSAAKTQESIHREKMWKVSRMITI